MRLFQASLYVKIKNRFLVTHQLITFFFWTLLIEKIIFFLVKHQALTFFVSFQLGNYCLQVVLKLFLLWVISCDYFWSILGGDQEYKPDRGVTPYLRNIRRTPCSFSQPNEKIFFWNFTVRTTNTLIFYYCSRLNVFYFTLKRKNYDVTIKF